MVQDVSLFMYRQAGLFGRGQNDNLLDIRIWASNRKVNIQGAVSDKAICEVFDTFGHNVFSIHLTDSEYNTFNLQSVAKGVYLVRVIDGVKVVTSKVVFL